MYQMHAYARQYETPHVLLLYPHHDGLNSGVGLRETYQLETGGAVQKVSVGTVDLTVDLRDHKKVAMQLEKMILSGPLSGGL